MMHSDDARNVLRLLQGGFVNVKLTDDNVETYVEGFSTLIADPGVAMAVAMEWVATRLSFPTVAEFVDECGKEIERRRRRARAIAEAQAHRQPGMYACMTCQDRRMVEIESLEGGVTVSPCPDCDPDGAAYWSGGHYLPTHDVGACDHPRCRQRQREIEGKVKNRGERGDDRAQRLDPAMIAEHLSEARAQLGVPSSE